MRLWAMDWELETTGSLEGGEPLAGQGHIAGKWREQGLNSHAFYPNEAPPHIGPIKEKGLLISKPLEYPCPPPLEKTPAGTLRVACGGPRTVQPDPGRGPEAPGGEGAPPTPSLPESQQVSTPPGWCSGSLTPERRAGSARVLG